MRASLLLAAPLAVNALNIVMSNDDGWAEANVRTLFDTLQAAGHNTVLSAPAENQSGTGSSDETPSVRTSPCQFNSCPANSPATGFNATSPRLNYVNSYPVTSMKHGIDTVGPKFFNGGRAELAVSGPNVGWNPTVATFFSGTVGAAVYASTNGIPAIAFSGRSGEPTAWNLPTPKYSKIYAELANKITETVIASGTPYLPENVFLNVNFPEVEDDKCNDVSDFKFILTRIFPGIPLITKDVETCGETILPWDITTVTKSSGCYISVSVGDANDKTDAAREAQAVVLSKLGKLLSCLP